MLQLLSRGKEMEENPTTWEAEKFTGLQYPATAGGKTPWCTSCLPLLYQPTFVHPSLFLAPIRQWGVFIALVLQIMTFKSSKKSLGAAKAINRGHQHHFSVPYLYQCISSFSSTSKNLLPPWTLPYKTPCYCTSSNYQNSYRKPFSHPTSLQRPTTLPLNMSQSPWKAYSHIFNI